MTKAKRMIEKQMSLVDVVVELLDARIPESSANPILEELIGSKPRIIALNKSDLAEIAATQDWIKYYRSKGLPAIPLDSTTGQGSKPLLKQIELAASEKIAKLLAKGIRERAVRAMFVGIPNVGKSSLINRFLGSATARTGDKPGVTRGQQWLKVGKNLELLDTPGVLWPRLDDQEAAFKLAITGAIKDEAYDMEKVITDLVALLRRDYSERLAARYNLAEPLPGDVREILSLIGAKRGCLRSGGELDLEKAGKIVFMEFRTGKLGPVTLDKPDLY